MQLWARAARGSGEQSFSYILVPRANQPDNLFHGHDLYSRPTHRASI